MIAACIRLQSRTRSERETGESFDRWSKPTKVLLTLRTFVCFASCRLSRRSECDRAREAREREGRMEMGKLIPQ